jgi:hypothetical protein
MSDFPLPSAVSGNRRAQTAGWYVPPAAALLFALLFFAFARGVEAPPDVVSAKIIDVFGRYAAFGGAALGLIAFLATGLAYLILRLLSRRWRRVFALGVTAVAYAALAAVGYDLVYLEPRYAEVARAIITYLGRPTLYAAAIVVGAATLALVAEVIIKLVKRTR